MYKKQNVSDVEYFECLCCLLIKFGQCYYLFSILYAIIIEKHPVKPLIPMDRTCITRTKIIIYR